VRTVETQVLPQPPKQVHTISITCDGCGGEIATNAAVEEQYANRLAITLNEHECVSMTRYRDYCTACLEPIWDAISKLIKADPEQDGADPASAAKRRKGHPDLPHLRGEIIRRCHLPGLLRQRESQSHQI
jgi:hypothetical protein